MRIHLLTVARDKQGQCIRHCIHLALRVLILQYTLTLRPGRPGAMPPRPSQTGLAAANHNATHGDT